MLKPGEQAPDVPVRTHLGEDGPISQFWAEGPLILFFYPKDNTSVCTKEACTLQANLNEFGNFKARVIGSSTDSLESHVGFAKSNSITFPLVADVDGKLAKAYKARRGLIGISKRITYVITPKGIIKGGVHNEFSVNAHLEKVRALLAGEA